MNLKVKITFLIIMTLIIGIVIGAMINRAVSQNRIKRILERRNPPIFISFYERIIEPNADQHDSIRKILDKYAQSFSEIRTDFQEQLHSSFESMKAELDPLLTPEQKERLERGFPRPPRFFPPPFMMIDANQELAMLKERLGLSEEQASQVKIILEDLRGQAEKMREGRRRPRGRFQIMKELEEKKEQSIEKILTEDQKKIYDEIKKERKRRTEEGMRQRHEMMREHNFPGF